MQPKLLEKLRSYESFSTIHPTVRCMAFITLVTGWAWPLLYAFWGTGPVALTSVAALLAATVCWLYGMRQEKPPSYLAEMAVGALFAALLVEQYLTGGIFSPHIMWFLMVPTIALLLSGIRSAWRWAIATMLALFAFFYLDSRGINLPAHIPVERRAAWTYLSFITALFTVSTTIMLYSVLQENTLKKLRREQKLLAFSEERFRSVAESASDAIITIKSNGRINFLNKAAGTIFGYAQDELIDKPLEILIPERHRGRHANAIKEVLSSPHHQLSNEKLRDFTSRQEFTGLRKDGGEIPLEMSLSTWKTAEGCFITAILRDVSEHKSLEQQLLQAQKMETIGRLAGGVAHDFNNLLTVITGHATFAAEDVQGNEAALADINEILKAAERASSLTNQLLAFSRRQILEPKVINLNDLILDMDKMLRRLLSEDVTLVTTPSLGLKPVRVDPGQIEQVLVNLVVNARDAITAGGTINIETANVTLGEDYARRHLGAKPGEYVMLAISDTGTGMPEEVKAHLFEPFFTTKEIGKGTGLGLATIYGIVKQHQGDIWVYSEPGEGTTFKIYLPVAREEHAQPLPPSSQNDSLLGDEVILIAEDEPAVRAVAARALARLGYTVLEASNGQEAMVQAVKSRKQVTLLITDVVMPHMSGKELATRLQEHHPGLQVLYVSGYTENSIVHHGVLDEGLNFLQKPFTAEALACRVRQVLDRGRDS